MEKMKSPLILLVEDDPGDQKIIKFALFQQGFEHKLKIVGTGEEALEYLASSKENPDKTPTPNLILLDLNMPGIGGKEFLRRLKSDKEFCYIPVVVVSTSDSDIDIEESYKLHASGYVQKISDLTELGSVIEKLTRYWFVTSRLVYN